jgi:hypothetical protein
VITYDLPGNSKRCHATGRELRPGEWYVSALVETPAGLERRDYAPEAWSAPDGLIGFWKGRLPDAPRRDDRPKPLSTETIRLLFDQQREAAERGDEQARQLRFVLALWLIRRKALKLQGVERDEADEFLVVRPSRGKDLIRVLDPRLSEERLRDVEERLRLLLERPSDAESPA